MCRKRTDLHATDFASTDVATFSSPSYLQFFSSRVGLLTRLELLTMTSDTTSEGEGPEEIPVFHNPHISDEYNESDDFYEEDDFNEYSDFEEEGEDDLYGICLRTSTPVKRHCPSEGNPLPLPWTMDNADLSAESGSPDPKRRQISPAKTRPFNSTHEVTEALSQTEGQADPQLLELQRTKSQIVKPGKRPCTDSGTSNSIRI